MVSKAKPAKHRNVANEPYIVAMRGLRSSGAAGTHDTRQRGQRDRKGAKDFAVKDSSS